MANYESQTQAADSERGVNFFQCTRVELRDLKSDWLRHAVQFSAGNQDFALDGAVDTHCKDASPDTHGQRNIRGVLRNFSTTAKAKIGNVSYPAGDQEIVVENGVCETPFEIQGGSGNIRMTNVSAQYLQMTTIRNFPDFYPHDCEFLSCTFTNPEEGNDNNDCFTLAMDPGTGSGDLIRRFTNLVFRWCSFVQERETNQNWCVIVDGTTADSDASFLSCSFSQKDDRELVKTLAQTGGELVLNFDGCTFDSIPNHKYAFFFQTVSIGTCTIKDNTFYTDDEEAEWVDPTSDDDMVLEDSGGNNIEVHP